VKSTEVHRNYRAHLATYTGTYYDDDRKLFEESTKMIYDILDAMDEVGVTNIAFIFSLTVYNNLTSHVR